MIYKPRSKPHDLIILELLNHRMNLTGKDKSRLLYLQKGYAGEVLFDSMTEKLQCKCLILNDLLLEMNNTVFQIDSLIIMQRDIYLYEVKNYDGNHYYERDKFYKKPKLELINPLDQLNRSESLLRQLFRSLGFNLQMNASVVFINPKFTLYQAPLDKPIIFHSQIKNHLNYLDTIPTAITGKHTKIAEQLLSMQMNDNRYNRIPHYEYDKLRKGIICINCHSYSVTIKSRNCICPDCGHAEKVADAVLRTIKEFKLLFPHKKITTNIIHDWCAVIQSKKRIRRVLSNNFQSVGVRQWTHYE